MGQENPRVHSEPDVVRRLTYLVMQLPGNAKVTVEYGDGHVASGIVCVRPTLQSFRDRDGKLGVNSLLRLEDASAPGGERHIWLDTIHCVRPLLAYEHYGVAKRWLPQPHPKRFTTARYRSLNL